MFSQFFGNYLLNEGLVTTEQLTNAIQDVNRLHTRIGELAVRYGYLTPEQVEQIHILQTREDKRFGELVVEHWLMTGEEMSTLLDVQHNDYELLCKVLVDNHILSQEACDNAVEHFKQKYRLEDMDNLNLQQTTQINALINDFFDLTGLNDSKVYIKYISLLFNNITRFIGNDFTPFKENLLKEAPADMYIISQDVSGPFNARTAIAASEEALIGLASRYAEEDFTEFDEYVTASIQDFLNLHNGLFTVNAANEFVMNLTLTPPVESDNGLDYANKTVYCLPIGFPFGTINFIVSDL